MTDALNPDRKELLSSYLDQETQATEFSETEHLLKDSFGAQVHYRNLETVIHACQQQHAPMPEHNDFLANLMGRIDGLEQEIETEDPECISAWIDGQYELDTEAVQHSQSASLLAQNMRMLSQAMQALPQPEYSQAFVQDVMACVDLSTAPDLKTLSAFYDDETTGVSLDPDLLGSGHQDCLQNYEILSHAMAHLSVPQAPDFLSNLMAALPEVHPQDLGFEFCSAYFDQEENLELSSLPQIALSLENIKTLSHVLQSLPEQSAPEGFVDAVMQKVDQVVIFDDLSEAFDGESGSALSAEHIDLHNLTILSQSIQNLPLFEATQGFVDRVMQEIDSEIDFESLSAAFDGEEKMELSASHPRQRDLQALSHALNNLPQPEAPVDFVARVMNAVELQSDFESLSAHFDGEQSSTLSVNLDALPEMKQMKALSRALQALPQPECSHDFVARVMLATEQTHKARIFALPSLFQTRFGQLVAGFALFGVLALITQSLLTGTEEVASVSDTTIVQVQYQAEDILFADVLDDSLENVAENDYNLLIGG